MQEKELIFDEMSESIIAAAAKLASESGVESVNVRMVLQELDITNRVFYNRFHNIDEVLQIVYERLVLQLRKSITFDPAGDFFSQVIEIVANTLVMSYELKMKMNDYVFRRDSIHGDNYLWWKTEIGRLIDFGKAKGLLKDVDSEVMSYAIWCYIRGYNADAVGRKLPLDIAVKNFKYAFGILLDGMKA
ncbi:MAG: TetR/AcrR family transcriptional regulator [Ruminococcaceae bacterium]|nr:TetR/AcrR family transcriptional regulator [Oscillospiraceae bacterium]